MQDFLTVHLWEPHIALHANTRICVTLCDTTVAVWGKFLWNHEAHSCYGRVTVLPGGWATDGFDNGKRIIGFEWAGSVSSGRILSRHSTQTFKGIVRPKWKVCHHSHNVILNPYNLLLKIKHKSTLTVCFHYTVRLHFISIVHFRQSTNYKQLCNYMSTNCH